MSIENVKLVADTLAEEHAAYINARANVVGVTMIVKPNYKFFRRMAGLRNSDLVKLS